jgi:DNA-binding protein HU-beta
MNQKQLIFADQQRAIQKRDGMHINKADIEAVFASLADITMEEMSIEGGEVPLPGIGTLKAAIRAARTGTNPATGAEIQIPAKNTVKFAAAKILKDALA